MYAWYRQLHHPTTVENSIFCNFISENDKDLVVAAASQLTVYRLQNSSERKPSQGKSSDTANDDIVKNKLDEIGSWSLFGNIVSMQSVRLAGAKRDSILLSFCDAKLCIIEFDTAMFDIKTTSLHYFEDNLIKSGMFQRVCLPKVAVDPDNRCSAMQINATTIAVIPFRSTDISLATENNSSSANLMSKRSVSSYELNLREVDSRLQRIVDIVFLAGYYEPTLLILFESLRTWSGRVSLRQDTCHIVAISLNITERLNPVIWSLSGLPYDCKKAYAVPKPIGGVLIFAVNSLIYLNQSVPPYGVSLSSATQCSTSFPLKEQEGVTLSLDSSLATFVAPESLVISLKTGDLYVVTLLVDSMRSVRNFHFDKAASSVLSSCITSMDNGYLFLGSRLGNSLLLHYITGAKPDSSALTNNGTEGPAVKRKRLNTDADWAATDPNDQDEVEMYGKDVVMINPLSSYKFQVCDSLVNIGPCLAAELGEPSLLSEEFLSQREADLELAILCGHGKNGALSVLQRTVKPQVVTTFELPGCINMWTVCTTEKMRKSKGDPDHHGYLILSREDTTLILETGKEIMEIEESGYNTRESTVFVGNIGENLILQVCSASVSLMDGVELLQIIPLDLGSPIIKCSLCNPYAVLITEDGQIIILTLKEDLESECNVQLHCSNSSISQSPQITNVCIYCDKSGLFVAEKDSKSIKTGITEFEIEDEFKQAVLKQEEISQVPKTITADEEDELLYGESDFGFQEQMVKAEPMEEIHGGMFQDLPDDDDDASKETYWLVLSRDNSDLEVYDMPGLNLVYAIKNFAMGRRLLVDSSSSYSIADNEKTTTDNRTTESTELLEILMVGLGHNSTPYLMARFHDDFYIYQVFAHHGKSSTHTSGLKIRFRKVEHNMIMRRNTGAGDVVSVATAYQHNAQMCVFDNIAGYSGVFIAGLYPYWVFMTPRGSLRCHPMNVDGHVTSFVPFHNINCRNGFLYFNNKGELRICMLPTHMKYDHQWPLRKVNLRNTPHFISYSIEHKVYALVTSVSEPCTRLPYLTQENEKEFEDLQRDSRFLYPHIDKFSVQLISPQGWELVPNARVDMDEFEHVTCMKSVWLNPSPDTTVRQNYIVIGTSNIMGEEMSSRGRIIILQVIEVVPEPGQPLTKNKLKEIYAEEQKGSVTALCGVEGNLLAAIGQKVFVWRFDDSQKLRGLAFVDSNVYIHQAISFRSFAIVADIQRSITLLRYQEDFKTLSVMSKDVKPLEVYSCDLLVDGKQVAFVVSDHDKNIIIYNYDPEARESVGGSRLTRRCDMNIGSNVNCMWRIGASQVDRSTGMGNESYAAAHITMMGTLDGGICEMIPIAEKTYRRLSMLQNIISTSMQHPAGLNPKSFRNLKTQSRHLINPAKNMVDGDLVWKYIGMSKVEQFEHAKKIGTTPDQILGDLMDIHRATCVM